MKLNQILLKGYFIWNIPFLFLACQTISSSAAKQVNPKDCEWYVVQSENKEDNNNNQLDIYAIRFYPDGNYTLCADLLFEHGKWQYDEKKKCLVLTSALKETQDDLRYLVDQTINETGTKFSFYHGATIDRLNPDEIIKVHAVANQSKFDPYQQSMHSWRIKPVQPETPGQIHQRVVAYVNFIKALYVHAKENNLENVGGSWYPQPIKFYSNKVSMAYSNELVDWYNCFFNEEQGIEGYKLISAALMKVKIKGTDGNTRNIHCCEQLLEALKN
jgi:hypothetical protein